MQKTNTYTLKIQFLKTLILMLSIILFLFPIVAAIPAYASDSEEFILKVTIGKETVTAIKYSLSQLENFNQTKQVYSSLDSTLSPSIVLAQGVSLSDVLKESNINADEVESINFSSTDGWSHTFDKEMLNSQRYYFKDIVSDGNNSSSKILSGAQDNKTAVYPMLALKSYQEKFTQNPDWSKISNSDGIRFCFGQASIEEQAVTNYGKNINEINITLKEGSTFVSLDPSINNQYFKPGTIVNLKGFIKGFDTAIINVVAPIGITLVTKEIGNVPDGNFSYELPVDSNVMEGKYTIIISPNKDSQSYKAKFIINISKNDVGTTVSKITSTVGGEKSVPVINNSGFESVTAISSLSATNSVETNNELKNILQTQEGKAQNNQSSQIRSQSQPMKVYEMLESAATLPNIKQEGELIPYAAVAALAFFILGMVVRFRKYKSEV